MSWRRQFRYDPDIGYTFIPNLKMRHPHESGGYLVQTNAMGFRDERVPSATSTSKQVLIFGDSFTAGDGVSNGQRFSDAVQRSTGADVFNFGLSGSGTDQQFIAYQKFARGLRCDVLVVAVLVENVRRITSQFRPQEADDKSVTFQAKPYFQLVDGKLVRYHDPVPQKPLTQDELALLSSDPSVDTGGRFRVLRGLVTALGLKETIQRLTEYQPVPDYDEPTSAGWRLMRAILLEWRAMHAGPMVVMPVPLYQHVEETASAAAYQRRFAELAAEADIIVHDVLPDLLRYEKVQRRAFRFATDVHLTPLGHTAIAESLGPRLSALLAL
jgi:GDSL-like Lipase/Acylhydrolase family